MSANIWRDIATSAIWNVTLAPVARDPGANLDQLLAVTLDYAASCRRLLEADREHKDALEMLIGASEIAERQAGWQSRLIAIDDGLLRRELFVATPDRM
jgi:hypothetical protein